MRFKIPKEVLDASKVFAKKKHDLRKNNRDKWTDGNEMGAEFSGFFLEFAACHVFKQPFPELHENHVGLPWDIEVKGIKLDVKASKNCWINKGQYDNHKGGVDGFLFGIDELINYEEGHIYANFFGWIRYDNVPVASELVDFSMGSKSYKVNRTKLRDVKELIE